MNAKLLLIQWLVLMAVPLLFWMIPMVRRFVPLVMIQIAWGFTLGPSLLGATHPAAMQALFPPESIPTISMIGFYAVVFFVFLTGSHLDAAQLSGKGSAHAHKTSVHHVKQFWTISLTSLFVPMALGCVAAGYLWSAYPVLRGTAGGIAIFIVSIGLAAGVTALPVLSAILVETKRINSRIGRFVLSCSTVHDGLLWLMLSIILAMIGGNDGHTNPLVTILLTSLYVVLMMFVVKPAMASFILTDYWKSIPDFVKLTLEAIGLAVSALITEAIGIHYLLGAVLFGVVLPPEIKRPLIKRVESLIVAVFLPFFFGSAGLKTTVNITAPEVWIIASVITVIVLVGQLLGTTLVAKRFFGNTWADSFEMGAYMGSKGIVEIVILGIMLHANLISNVAYAGMIIMAIACTALTKPIVYVIHRFRAPAHEEGHAPAPHASAIPVTKLSPPVHE